MWVDLYLHCRVYLHVVLLQKAQGCLVLLRTWWTTPQITLKGNYSLVADPTVQPR